MSIRPSAWAKAYRPLHPTSLTVQFLILTVAEFGLFATYGAHDARFHWATHFLVAVTISALVMATEGDGRTGRFVGSPAGLWDGTGCALALAPWALAQQREGARLDGARYTLRGEGDFGVDFDVACDADGGWTMRGCVRVVSDGRVVG